MTTGSGEWVNPGTYEVVPGVHRIPLPLPNDGLRAVNVYVVDSEAGPVLIDAGWDIPEAREALVAGLDSIGHGLADVQRFLVTHVHRDHYTQAITVRREFGTSVALGIGERPTLELLQDRDRNPLGAQVEALRLHGAGDNADKIEKAVKGHPRSDLGHWEDPDTWLTEGPVTVDADRELEAVATPGHTVGHVVFYDNDASILFAGDHVLPTITPSIGFEPVLSPDPLAAFLRSLAVVRGRPDALLLPAHGPVAPSAHARVDELIAHHGRRLDQTEQAVRQGPSSPYEVAAELRWTRHERRLDELDFFNSMLAVFETGAHLDLLVSQGRLAMTIEDGVQRYRERA